MSIRVVADGADGYRLFSPANQVVGWVRGRVIGVSGFENENVAVSAAIRSYGVLAPWLEQQRLHPFPALPDGPVRFVHDGAHRWILIGRVPVARFPDGTRRDSGARGHAFEIVLKGSVSEGMIIHAALVTLHAAHGKITPADVSGPARQNTVGASDVLAPITHREQEAR
jgi:hypothetical protein